MNISFNKREKLIALIYSGYQSNKHPGKLSRPAPGQRQCCSGTLLKMHSSKITLSLSAVLQVEEISFLNDKKQEWDSCQKCFVIL
jgi:hypothetical protein